MSRGNQTSVWLAALLLKISFQDVQRSATN